MDLLNTIREKSREFFDDTVLIRRHLHRHPELSFSEFETSGYISNKLKEYGIDFRHVANTGIAARITGRKGGGKQCVALRAELDALPVTEETGLPFSSVNHGVMHACGHDVHAASLLGSARVIKSLEDQFSGTVWFIFQPGEETLPGGAKKMIDENIFEGEEPGLIIAQHVLPEMDAGKAGLKPGIYMASGDEIYITVTGSGGHGALPPHNYRYCCGNVTNCCCTATDIKPFCSCPYTNGSEFRQINCQRGYQCDTQRSFS
jgi:amidohydrolase